MRRLKDVDIPLITVILLIAVIPLYANMQYHYSGNTYISDYIIDSVIACNDDPVNAILNVYNNSGFPFAAVNIDSALMIGSLSQIFISIEENSRYRISGIINRGNIKPLILENIFNFNDHYYSDTLIMRGISFIQARLGVTEDISFTPYLREEGLFIETDISEEQYSYITGLLATSFENDLFGFLDADIYSPQGYGRHYCLYYERSSENMTQMNAEIQFPYMLKAPLSFAVNGFYSDYDSLTAKAGGNLDAVYFTGIMNISAGIGRNWILSSIEEQNNRYTVISTGISTGIMSQWDAYAEFAHYEGNESFGKTYIGISNLFKFGTIFIRPGIYGNILVYSDTISSFQKEKIGGTASIRGVAENALVFTNIFYSRLEAGLVINENIRTFLLTDAGMYNENALNSIYNDILTYGAGLELISGNIETGIYAALPFGSDIYASRIHIMLKYLF